MVDFWILLACVVAVSAIVAVCASIMTVDYLKNTDYTAADNLKALERKFDKDWSIALFNANDAREKSTEALADLKSLRDSRDRLLDYLGLEEELVHFHINIKKKEKDKK